MGDRLESHILNKFKNQMIFLVWYRFLAFIYAAIIYFLDLLRCVSKFPNPNAAILRRDAGEINCDCGGEDARANWRLFSTPHQGEGEKTPKREHNM